MKTVCLEGEVISGKGEGSRFIELPWAQKQIEEELGFAPYPGTLNVRLTAGTIKMRKALMKAAGAKITPAPGYCAGKLFKASLMNLKCAVILPEVSGYPKGVIEIISSMNLREGLHLVDGDLVEVEVTF